MADISVAIVSMPLLVFITGELYFYVGWNQRNKISDDLMIIGDDP